MKSLLDSLYRQQTFPRNYTRNDLGIKFYRQLLLSAVRDSPQIEIKYKTGLAYQLLYDNQTDSAIRIFKEILDRINQNPGVSAADRCWIYDALALGYMRRGELQNCLTNHNAASCTYPFTANGIHKDPSGSDSAIGYLLRSLEADTANASDIWLLNILAMTVNKYPGAVPLRFQVDMAKYSQGNDFAHFKNIAKQKGIDHYGHYGGVSVDDFDNDGLPDVFTTSGYLNENVNLYLQTRDSGFSDRTEEAGLTGITGGVNTVDADFDNDGLTDIYIMRGGWQGRGGMEPGSLLRNLGNGKFEDVTMQAGLLSFKPSHTACWGDFNNDGLLDLFVGHENNDFNFSGPFTGCSSDLYLNNGNGTFTEVSAKCGININDFVKGSTWMDYNNDGMLDLYLSVYGGRNMLYRNDGPDATGAWHFSEVSHQAGVEGDKFNFPVAAFDINQDGWDDLFMSGYDIDNVKIASEYQGKIGPVSPSKIYINQKNGTFRDMTDSMGLSRSIYAMALNFGDLDLDGYPDIYLGTGFGDYAALFPNVLLRNMQGRKFSDVTSASGTGQLQKGHGIAICDIDHDGDNDIYAQFGGFYSGDKYWNSLYENPGNSNKWLSLKLQGTTANRSAIGSKIKITVNTATGQHDIYAKIGTGGSYGCSPLQQLIGLGQAISIERVEIIWPGATIPKVIPSLKLNRAYLIKQNTASAEELPYTPIRGNAKTQKASSAHHVM